MLGTINGSPLNLDGINEAGTAVSITGFADLVTADAGVSSAGVAVNGASSTPTTDPVQLASAGVTPNIGSCVFTEAGDSLASAGSTAIGADSDLSMAGIGLTHDGVAPIGASLAQTQDAQVLTSDGEIQALRAVLDLVMAPQTLASTGSTSIAADAALTEGGDASSSAGVVAVGASLTQALEDEILQAKFNALLQGITQGAGIVKRPAVSTLTPRAPGVNLLAD